MSAKLRQISRLSAAAAILLLAAGGREARAWNPPGNDGDPPDFTAGLTTPDTILFKTHGYLIQTGISVLYNDGYWFAAQSLKASQQELLNGVRYADLYEGKQIVAAKLCTLFYQWCPVTIADLKDWPYAADNHYYNPDTGAGLRAGALNDAASWGPYITAAIASVANSTTLGLVGGKIEVNPAFDPQYPSGVEKFQIEYGNAVNASLGLFATSINGRTGKNLSMFYLGWASHFMQDLTVVNHTYDDPLGNHSEYENAADGYVKAPPVADGQRHGIYVSQLPAISCAAGTSGCFPTYAASVSHDQNRRNAVGNGDYSSLSVAIPFAQHLQAGLYAKFLTDSGHPPVHMSAIMAARPIL